MGILMFFFPSWNLPALKDGRDEKDYAAYDMTIDAAMAVNARMRLPEKMKTSFDVKIGGLFASRDGCFILHLWSRNRRCHARYL